MRQRSGYFSGDEVKKLQYLIAKEKALSGQVSGDRFEDVLLQILPNCKKSKKNVRDKKWFDLSQPGRGIEVKTFQVGEDDIKPGTFVSNVLKRVPPSELPDSLTIKDGKNKRVNGDADPDEVGAALINYLETSMDKHAKEKDIKGRFDFAVLLRNVELTKVGYWEEPINFGKASDYEWTWSDCAIKGYKNDVEIFSWYWTNQRQLFYRFEAPKDVLVMDVPDLKFIVREEREYLKELKDEYNKGFADGKRKNI